MEINLSDISENKNYNGLSYNGTLKLRKSVDNKKIENIIKNIKP